MAGGAGSLLAPAHALCCSGGADRAQHIPVPAPSPSSNTPHPRLCCKERMLSSLQDCIFSGSFLILAGEQCGWLLPVACSPCPEFMPRCNLPLFCMKPSGSGGTELSLRALARV